MRLVRNKKDLWSNCFHTSWGKGHIGLGTSGFRPGSGWAREMAGCCLWWAECLCPLLNPQVAMWWGLWMSKDALEHSPKAHPRGCPDCRDRRWSLQCGSQLSLPPSGRQQPPGGCLPWRDTWVSPVMGFTSSTQATGPVTHKLAAKSDPEIVWDGRFLP